MCYDKTELLKGGDGMPKVVLVTGGSRGIGAAVCKKFAAEGYLVAVNYEKSREKAEALAEEIGGMAFCADVSDEKAVNAMFDAVEKQWGPVDVLINNAGISVTGLFQDCDEETWRRLFGVNVGGVFHCTKRALGGMLQKQSGAIVNLSSIWGVTGGSCECHYSATKAAVIGYTKALAKELGPSHIRVNAIAPGAVDTDMNAHMTKEDWEAFLEETPLGTVGQPEEIADAVFFLASEKASFITGAVLNVNGGSVI